MRLGTRREANEALLLDREGPGRKVADSPDWRFIGSGCFRACYLHIPSNLVYKVGPSDCNEEEAATAALLRDKAILPAVKVYIPRTVNFTMPPSASNRGYYSVVVQEFAGNTEPTGCEAEYGPDCSCMNDPCYSEIQSILARWSGLQDIHGENVLHNLDTGAFWIIDLAC